MKGVGQNETKIIKACLSHNDPIPSSILKAPVVDSPNLFYLTSFFDLATCRQIGMEEGRIPWRDIDFYANEKGLKGEFKEFFICVILNLDVEYINMRQELRPKTNDNKVHSR